MIKEDLDGFSIKMTKVKLLEKPVKIRFMAFKVCIRFIKKRLPIMKIKLLSLFFGTKKLSRL
jgi:hypothetical protein